MTIARHRTETGDGLDAARTLAVDSLRIGRMLRDPSRWPASWREPSFGVEVERIRRDIARFKSPRALAVAYWREVSQPADARRAQASAIRVAYALRCLELRDGVTGPSWQSLAG